MNFLKSFFKYLYSTNLNVREVQVGAVKTEEKDKKADAKDISKSEKSLRFKIGLIVTYAMTFLLICSFISILVYTFVLPDNEIPTILRDTFFALVGYFSGAFVSFYKLENGK